MPELIAAPPAPAAAPVVTATPVAPVQPVEAAVAPAEPVAAPLPKGAAERQAVLRAKALELLKTPTPAEPAAEAKAEVPKPAEPAPAEKPPEPAKPEEPSPFSKEFQRLAVERAELRRAKEAQKADAGQTREAFMTEMKALAKTNPAAVLERTGLSYAELTQHYLAAKSADAPEAKPSVDPQMAADIAEMKAWKQQVEQEKAQATTAKQVADFRGQVITKAKSGGEKYELVAAAGERAAQRVYEVLDEHYRVTGELPGGSIEAATELALAHVEKQLEAEALPLLQVGKLKAKLAPASPPLAEPRPNAESGQPHPVRTLTNSLSGAVPPKPNGKKSVAELRADALRVLQKGITGP